LFLFSCIFHLVLTLTVGKVKEELPAEERFSWSIH